MDANDLDSLPGKEGKIVLIVLLKMIFFHTDRNDSSKLTVKSGEMSSRVVGEGEGAFWFRTAVSCCLASCI